MIYKLGYAIIIEMLDILKKNIFDRIYGYELCTNIYMIKEYAYTKHVFISCNYDKQMNVICIDFIFQDWMFSLNLQFDVHIK